MSARERRRLADVEDDEPVDRARPAPGKVSLTAALPARDRVHTAADGVGALVAPVQMFGGSGREGERVHAAAARGLAAPVSALPFRAELERAFGAEHDLSGIRAHVGGEAEASARAMGADAYASGADVVLPGSPSLRLVAHEVTHTIQQRGGVQLSRGVGEVGDRYEREADDIAERVVRGERVGHLLAPRAAAPTGCAVQRQAAPAPADQGSVGDYVDSKVDLNVPNREQVIEISNDGQDGRFVVAGQIKVTLDHSPVVSASASATVDGGPLGDHAAQGKIDWITAQQKGIFRPHETKDQGRRLTERLAVSLAKPGAKLDVLPGLSVEVAGDLGQLNLANGQLSVGSINFSVKGDVTKWVLGDEAKRAGLKAELIAQIKVRLLPGDLKNLVAMAKGMRQLHKAEEATRVLRVAIQRDQAKLARIELALSKAMRQGARGAELAAKLRASLASVRASLGARAKALQAVRSQVKLLWRGLQASAGKLAATGAQIVGKQVLDVGSKLVQGILKAISAAFLILDLAQIGLALYRIADGTAAPKLGGGGPGSLLKKGAPGGTVPDGNADTPGAPDATGTGPGMGNDADVGPDSGNVSDDEREGEGGTSDVDDEAASNDDGVATDDGADTDYGTPLVDDGSVAADDADDVADVDDGDGGLGTATPNKPGGGPGAGAATGSEPSMSTHAGGGAVDRNPPPDAAPTPAPLATPSDDIGAIAHDGSTRFRADAANVSTGDEPAELVANIPALRVMSALDALGQPASPEIIALVEALIPADLTPEEVDALIDELMRWLVPGDVATEETTIEGLSEAVTAFIQGRELERRRQSGVRRNGGGSGTGNGAGNAARGSGTGTGAGSGARADGTKANAATKPGAANESADHGRVVLEGKGLTPTVFEDGTLALTQEQAAQWLKLAADKVAMSDAGMAWLSAHQGLVIKTKPASMKLENVTVSGPRNADGSYAAAITFTVRIGPDPVTKTVRFDWDPDAPTGKRAQVPHSVSLEPLERLVRRGAHHADIDLNVPVDLGPFTVTIVHVFNHPYADGPADAAFDFHLTIEITEVRDTAMATFRGSPVKVGTRLTGVFSLRPRGGQ